MKGKLKVQVQWTIEAVKLQQRAWHQGLGATVKGKQGYD